MSEKAEIWRPVVGYEGCYEISNLGNMRSLTRTVMRGGLLALIQGLPLRLKVNKSGYLYVNISKVSKSKTFVVHRIVAKAFLPNPQNLPVVNHVDFNVKNNAASNLEWCSVGDNVRHAIHNNRFGTQRLTIVQVLEIRDAYKAGDKPAALAALYDIGVRHVWRIGTGRSYAHVVAAT